MRNVLLCSMSLLFGVGLAGAQTADELLAQAVVEAGNAPTDPAVAELLRAEGVRAFDVWWHLPDCEVQ